MDMEQARYNMVEQQIRPWDVLDQDVLDLLFKVKREEFVPAKYRELAFSDIEIPLGQGQYMFSPKLEARVLQEIELNSGDKVLEVGTGSGYLTALLAQQAQHVYSVERIPEFKIHAELKLKSHGIHNVTLDIGDAARGWPRHGPYNVIVITGSLPLPPDNFVPSLAPNGKIFAIIGEAPVMQAKLIRCAGPGQCHAVTLFETSVPPLVNAPAPERFIF